MQEVNKQVASAKNYKERFLAIKDRVERFRSGLLDTFDDQETRTLEAITAAKQEIVELENKLEYWRGMVRCDQTG